MSDVTRWLALETVFLHWTWHFTVGLSCIIHVFVFYAMFLFFTLTKLTLRGVAMGGISVYIPYPQPPPEKISPHKIFIGHFSSFYDAEHQQATAS